MTPNNKDKSRRDFLKKTSALFAGGLSSFIMPVQNANAALYNPNVTELVQFFRGDLPILITAPHGGNELVFGIPARTNITRPVANFTFYGAVWTYEICQTISRTLQRLSGGKRPYMVLNLAHRRYLDVNREDSDAYEVTLNAPRIYWEYHDMIREFVNQMNILFDSPFLVEITGHNSLKDLIVRRTRNGNTVTKLRDRVGEENLTKQWRKLLKKYRKDSSTHDAIIAQFLKRAKADDKIKKAGRSAYAGEDSLIGEIYKRGYRIDPQLGVDSADIEIPQTTAGDFTIDRYGSHRSVGGMDAIQLVIGGDYRRTHNYAQTGRDIGNAIWSFAQNYNLIPNE